ncbi:hypothetical protein SDC9_101560 [bioreactor metagenome]|uniref:Uncharacterized protein n=1 Tax=bioreactor metagenome TaxID=1076179 RepID=A0A645ANV4_9ZZZZ
MVTFHRADDQPGVGQIRIAQQPEVVAHRIQAVAALVVGDVAVGDDRPRPCHGLLRIQPGVRAGQVVGGQHVVAQFGGSIDVATVNAGEQCDHLLRLHQAMPDERVDEVRSGLQRQLGLVALEHQGVVDAEAGFGELEGQIVPAQCVLGGGLPVAAVETAVAGEQLADIVGIDRTGVRHLDDNTILAEQFLEEGRLFEDLVEIRLEWIVEFHRDVTARTENAAEFGHHLITSAELVVDVRLGIVDEQVVDDAGVAGEVAEQGSDRGDLVRVRGVGGVDDGSRALASVAVIADVALQVDVQ